MLEFVTSLIITIISTFFIRLVAIRIGWIHRSNSSVPQNNYSQRIIALGGGLAIFISFAITVVMKQYNYLVIAILTLTSISLLLGVWDDLKNCHPYTKLIVQTFLGIVTCCEIGYVGGLPHWLSIPVTILSVVGLMNAVNILDNMDGMVSGLISLSMLGYAILGRITQNDAIVILSLVTAGACLGFWFHNRPPATIFMGDAGSMVLGFLLSIVGILSTHGQYPNELARFIAPLLLVGIFVANTVFVTIWRISHKLPITFWCLEHNLNYRIISLIGPSPWKVNLTFYAIQIGLSILAIVSVVTPPLISLFSFLLGVSGLFSLSRRLWRVSPEDVRLLGQR